MSDSVGSHRWQPTRLPLSLGFSRQEHWSGWPFPSPMHACMLSCFSRVRLCDPIDDSPPGSPCPWDSPGKNTGVGCHFLLQCMTVKRESEVAQLCLTLCNRMDCSPPGSSVHGIFQAKILGLGCHFQGIFPTQRSNQCFLHVLHGQVDSLPLAPLGKLKSNCTTIKKKKKPSLILLEI